MPFIRQYPEATSLQPTDAFVLDRIGVGSMFIDAQDFALTYDIAMGFPGLLPINAAILNFVAVRPVTISAGAPLSKAALQTAPTGSPLTFPVTAAGAGVGSIQFAVGSGVGVFTWPADVVLNPGNVLSIQTPGVTGTASGLSVTFSAFRSG